jgi:hypothetical protein
VPTLRLNIWTLLGAYQLGGGIVGSAYLLSVALLAPEVMARDAVIPSLIPFGLVAAAGGACIRRSKSALRLTMLSQGIQALSFSQSWGTWIFVAGFHLRLVAVDGVLSGSMGYELTLVTASSVAGSSIVAANFVPLIVLLSIWIWEPNP